MQSLKDYRDIFLGQTVTLVGGSKTPISYPDLAKYGTDNIMFINWSVRMANHFTEPRHNLFFCTWHLDMFKDEPNLLMPNMKVITFPLELWYLPPEVQERAITYHPINHEVYDPDWLDFLRNSPAVRDKDVICETNQLHSHANSTLLALHFWWLTGARQVNAVGMHDIGGVQAKTYDERLGASHEPMPASWYMRAQNDFSQIMGLPIRYME